MGLLDNLNTIITQLQNHIVTIGFTVAGLMIAAYAIVIMLSPEPSIKGHTTRWQNLEKVLICAAVIAGIGPAILFAQNIGHML